MNHMFLNYIECVEQVVVEILITDDHKKHAMTLRLFRAAELSIFNSKQNIFFYVHLLAMRRKPFSKQSLPV